jgi:hypothetical protein
MNVCGHKHIFSPDYYDLQLLLYLTVQLYNEITARSTSIGVCFYEFSVVSFIIYCCFYILC